MVILEQVIIIVIFIILIKSISWIFDKPRMPKPEPKPNTFTDFEIRSFHWIVQDNIRSYSLNCKIKIRLKESSEAKLELLNKTNTPSKIYLTSEDDYFNISQLQILDENYGYKSIEIEQIIDYLTSYANREMLSSYQYASLILSFVHEQNIKYSFDEDSTGYEEYLRYPLETIFDLTGDCDCKAILACTLFKRLGYRVAFALLPGHAALAITTESDLSFSNFYFDGSYWFYCESTGDNWKPGQLPNSFEFESIKIREI